MEHFIIRAYGRTELAQCYFPTLNPQVAIASCRAGSTIIPTCANASRPPAAIRMPASTCPCMSV